eukprot:31027-Pelagococcus_subviridis.AAC.14
MSDHFRAELLGKHTKKTMEMITEQLARRRKVVPSAAGEADASAREERHRAGVKGDVDASAKAVGGASRLAWCPRALL